MIFNKGVLKQIPEGFKLIHHSQIYLEDGMEFFIVLCMEPNGRFCNYEGNMETGLYWGHYVGKYKETLADYHERIAIFTRNFNGTILGV